jgi:RNA recognition motif-containing protein
MINIYVGNLPYSARNDDLKEIFEEYGTVNTAEIIFDRRTKRSRGYGFVEMADAEKGGEAIAELDGSDYEGRQIRVDESQPAEQNSDGRGKNNNRRNTKASQKGGILGFLKKMFS